MVARKIRWGILSTGKIAHTVAADLARMADAEMVAVGSRSAATAERFAAEWGIPRAHGSYAALAADPEVEAIYVATPHSMHFADSRLCLEHGKAVLCEKAFTLNADEAAALIALARARGLFLMEAMWVRFLPAMVQVREWLAEGRLGEVRMVQADFGFRAPFDRASRLFAAELAGGSLLDVGVYPISLASLVLGGEPESVHGAAHLGETGVDEAAAMVLGYAGGRLALLASALRLDSPREADILGTEGWLRLHTPAFKPQHVTLSLKGQEPDTYHFPFEGNGYQFQAAEVMRCLRAGLTESPVMPLDESLGIMRTMDRLRGLWGLRYPGEGG